MLKDLKGQHQREFRIGEGAIVICPERWLCLPLICGALRPHQKSAA